MLGGTFDPPHLGHLELARGFRELLGLERVLLVPAARPPHRVPPVAGTLQRCHMARLAIGSKDAAWLSVDERELHRPGPSYTVDTLNELSSACPGRPLCLLLGSDAAVGFTSWREWRTILGLAHLAVARRAGDAAAGPDADPHLAAYLCDQPQALRERPNGRILFTSELQLPGVSASGIRELLGRGALHDAASLLPGAVDRYIREQGLYH